MRQSRRYVLLFTAFVGLSTLAMAAVSALALGRAYSHFAAAPNKELAAALWRRTAFDAQVGLALGALLITAIAIPAGIGLWRMSSRRYDGILRRLESLVHERLGLEGRTRAPGDEQAAWEAFIPVFIRDLGQIRDREKIESWKEGARMLMHELRNPMTPLKLSAQRLALEGADVEGAAQRVLDATESMERILGYFKNLVNLEFGPREVFDGRDFLAGFSRDLRAAGRKVTWTESYFSGPVPVEAEKTLVRMLMDNLVNNGLEARPAGMIVRSVEKEACLELEFLTPDVRVTDPAGMFRPGQSTKGKGRGYGLFLGKTVSDYLDLDLRFRQDPEGAVFAFRLPKTRSPA